MATLLFSIGLAWRGWRVAGWAALTAAALAIGHTLSPGDALSPSLISMTLARGLPLWASLLTFAGSAAVLFAGSMEIRRSNANIPAAEDLCAAAAITTLTCAFVTLPWVGATTTSHSYTNLSTTTMYRAVVASGGCASANSTAATITVNALPTAYTVTGGGSYCPGGTGVSVGLSNSQSGVNYQLKLAGIDTGSPIAGTGSAISFGNNTAAGNYTVEATNASTSCIRTMTGSVNISINPLPSVSLAASSVDCFNSLLTATNSGGGMSRVTGTNGTDFSISSSGTPTISSTITLPAGYLTAASNLTVPLNIDHAGAGDLIATLISPSCGQTVLFNRPGGTGNTNDLVNNADYVLDTCSPRGSITRNIWPRLIVKERPL